MDENLNQCQRRVFSRVQNTDTRWIPAATVQAGAFHVEWSVGIFLADNAIHKSHRSTKNSVVDAAQNPVNERVSRNRIQCLQGRLIV